MVNVVHSLFMIRSLFPLACGLALFVLPLITSCAQAADTPAPTMPIITGPLLHPLFSDGAVLQRDRRIPVWGFARPGEQITLSLDGGKIKTTAQTEANGQWTAHIGPIGAGVGHTLEVSGPDATEHEIRQNIAFGDVWLCSGQSNMQFQIGGVNNATQERAAANYPNIRFFHVPQTSAVRPRAMVDTNWQVVTPETANNFSAVGYFFGRELHQKLNIPIGLIDASWGGTTGEVWASGTALKTIPDFKAGVEAVENTRTDVPFDTQMAQWMGKNDVGTREGWNIPSFDDSKWAQATIPGNFTQDAQGDLTNFDGIVWYRTQVDIPAAMAGHDAKISLGKIDDDDTTYWNGEFIGAAQGYDTAREYTIPAAQLKAGRGILSVRVHDGQGPGGFSGEANQFKIVNEGGQVALAGQWRLQRGSSADELSRNTTLPPVDERVYPIAPSMAFNSMISPLIPFGIKGAIWYQGESNAGRAEQYKALLSTLITDWRSRFGSGDFPFYIVQLAGFQAPAETPDSGNNWAALREAQEWVAAHVKNSGYSVTTDIGDQHDIHPHNKQDVGKRLALLALAHDYGQKVESSGPTVSKVEIEGDTVRLHLDHTEGGLTLDGEKDNVFALAGADKKWSWATATLDGDTIILRSPDVPKPETVRFAWNDFPRGNVYNGAHLPMAPYRSDS